MAQLKDLLVSGAAKFLNGIFVLGTSSMNDTNPAETETYSLGTNNLKWKNIYGKDGYITNIHATNLYDAGGTTTVADKYISTLAVKTTNGTTFTFKGVDGAGGENSAITVPNHDSTHAGLITNTTQTITGEKTFATANGFTYSGIGTGSDDTYRPVWFSYNGITGRPVYDNDFTYNPFSNTLKVDTVYRAFSANNQAPLVWMNGADFDNWLWKISSGTANGNQYYEYGLKYIGTGSGVANHLRLYADNQNQADVIAIGINQNGQVGIGADANTSYRFFVNGTSLFNNLIRLYRESDTVTNSPAGIVFENKDTTTTKSQTNTHIFVYNDHNSADTYGANMVISSAGNTFLGGGESADALYALKKSDTAENLYLTANNTVYIYANSNTIANRVGIAITKTGDIVPQTAGTLDAATGIIGEAIHNNVQNIGELTNFFNNVYSRWTRINTGKVNNDGGLSLYGYSASYAIAMRSTGSDDGQLGTHGYVTNDWATYFIMSNDSDNTPNRGWIFRESRINGNVTSINTRGYLSTNRICLNRGVDTGNATVGSPKEKNGRIYWYTKDYGTWVDYMSQSTAGYAPTGGQPSTTTEVTSWAQRSLIENAAGYGWIWEASANTTTATTTTKPTARMSLSSNTGRLRILANASSVTTKTAGLIVSSEENGDQNDSAIELWRGANVSWQIRNSGGILYFMNNYANSTVNATTYNVNSLILDHATGAASLPYLALGQTARTTSYKLYVNGDSGFNGHALPHTTNTFDLGSTSKYWRNIYVTNGYLNGQTANRLVWTDADKKMHADYHYADSTNVAINSSSQPAYNFLVSGTTRLSGNTTANHLYTATDSTYDVGQTTAHWRYGYFDGMFISTNNGFTSSAGTQGIQGSFLGAGYIEMSASTPYIDLHNALSTADYSVRIISDAANRLHIQAGDTSAELSYKGRTITPLTYHQGTLYASSNIESAGYFLNNINAVGGGYYVYGNNKQYGRLYISAIGTAEDQGETTFVLGNSIPNGTAENSRGQIFLYSTNATYTGLMSHGNNTTTHSFYFQDHGQAGYSVSATGYHTALGSATKGIYLDANGVLREMTYSSNSTVNAGTANRLAYYSGANTISSTSIISNGTYIYTTGAIQAGTLSTNYGTKASQSDGKAGAWINAEGNLHLTHATAGNRICFYWAGSTSNVALLLQTSDAFKFTAGLLVNGYTSRTMSFEGTTGSYAFAVNGGGFFTGTVRAVDSDIITNGGNFYARTNTNSSNYGRLWAQTEGTASDVGVGRLTLGNGTASGTAGNAKGSIYIYDSNTYYHHITPNEGGLTANRTHYLPNAGGWLVSGATAGVGDASTPVYVSSGGVATACGVKPLSSITDLGWDTTADQQKLARISTLTFWNGRYDSSNSNLKYQRYLVFTASSGSYGTSVPSSGETGQVFFKY